MINLDEQKKELLKELEMEQFPTEVQSEILAKLSETIILSVTAEVLEKLNETEQQTFKELLEKQDDAGLRAFLLPLVPNLDDLVDLKTREEIAGLKKQL